MKNKVIILMSFLGYFLCSCTSSDKDFNDLVERNLRGRVKMLIETTYKAVEKFGEVVPDKQTYHFQYNFDKDGMLILDEGPFRKIERNDAGRITKITIYDKDSIIKEDIFVYEKDKVVKKSCKDSYRELRYEYKYNGNFISEIDKYENDEFISKTKQEKKNKEDIIFKKYDSDGQLQEYGETVFNNGVYKKNTIYDKSGNLINVFIFDDYGNLVSFKKNSKTYDYEQRWVYEFDSQGNWVKQIYYTLDKPQEITIRQIEYY